MNSTNLVSILASIDALSACDGKVTRTHIHKLLYLAETWGVLPPAHSFTLHRFGPYSFDLDGEIQALRSVGIIEAQPAKSGYGAHYSVGEFARRVGKNERSADKRLRRMAEWLGPLQVKDLEAIATAEFVRQSFPEMTDEEIVARVLALKPHLLQSHVQKSLADLKQHHQAITA